MAINWSSFTDSYNVWHPVGNCFRQNVRTANAFEAVITAISDTNDQGSVATRQISLTATGEVKHYPAIS